jgi:hypothetical protein
MKKFIVSVLLLLMLAPSLMAYEVVEKMQAIDKEQYYVGAFYEDEDGTVYKVIRIYRTPELETIYLGEFEKGKMVAK